MAKQCQTSQVAVKADTDDRPTYMRVVVIGGPPDRGPKSEETVAKPKEGVLANQGQERMVVVPAEPKPARKPRKGE